MLPKSPTMVLWGGIWGRFCQIQPHNTIGDGFNTGLFTNFENADNEKIIVRGISLDERCFLLVKMYRSAF